MFFPSGSLHRMPKNNTTNWGKGKFLVFATIFVGIVWKMKKAKKGQVLSIWIQNKFALWNKWPLAVTNTCSGEEKQQIIQNKTFIISFTTWLYWIKNKTVTDLTLYTTWNETTISKIRPSATKYILSYIQGQNTNLYVQIPINNRKTGKLYWFLNNTDSWKIQQILRATIVGKISEL